MRYYNEDTDRMAQPVVFGYAVYTCHRPTEDGQVRANRYGMVKDAEDVDKWLNGADPKEIASLITEHPSEFATTHTVRLT